MRGYVGGGRTRNVYVHPHDPQKCIKVVRTDFAPTGISLQRRLKCVMQEAKYYEKKQNRRSVLAVAQYYEQISIRHEGNTLPAHVFRLIRNADGRISRQLRAYQHQRREHSRLDEILQALDFMHETIIACNLLCGFAEQNIVVKHKQDGAIQTYIVDSIRGTKAAIPNWANQRGRRKCTEQYLRFRRYIENWRQPT